MKKTITIFTMLIMIIFLINISCTGDVVYIVSGDNNSSDTDHHTNNDNNDNNVTIIVETDNTTNTNNNANTGNNTTSFSNRLSGKWEGNISYENPETKKQEKAKGVFTFTDKGSWKLEGKSGSKLIEIYNGSYTYDEKNGNLTLIYERMNSGTKMMDVPNGFLGKQVETIGFDNNRMVFGMYVGGDTKTLNGKWRQTKSITLKGADKPFFRASVELDIKDGKVKMSGDFITTSDSGINNSNDISEGWGNNFNDNSGNGEDVPDYMNNTTMAFSINGNAKIKNLDTGSQTFTVYDSSDKPEKEEDSIFSNGDYRYITVGNGLFFAKERRFEIDYFERIN